MIKSQRHIAIYTMMLPEQSVLWPCGAVAGSLSHQSKRKETSLLQHHIWWSYRFLKGYVCVCVCICVPVCVCVCARACEFVLFVYKYLGAIMPDEQDLIYHITIHHVDETSPHWTLQCALLWCVIRVFTWQFPALLFLSVQTWNQWRHTFNYLLFLFSIPYDLRFW